MAVTLGVPAESPQLRANQDFVAPQLNTGLIDESRRYARRNFDDALNALGSVYKGADTLRQVTEQAYAQKATNEYRSKANQKLAELQILKGEDFINAYKNFDKDIDLLRKEISDKYTDSQVKDIFTISSQDITSSVKDQASNSNIKAVFDFKVDQLKASIAENSNEMMLNFNDVDLRNKSLDKIKKGVAALADMQGLPKGSEQAKQLERETLDKGISSAITYQISTKNFGSARTSLEQMKNSMEASTYLKLKAKLNEAIESESLKNALKAKQNQEKYSTYKPLSRVETERLYQQNFDIQLKALKTSNPNMSEAELRSKANIQALNATKNIVDQYNSIGDIEAKSKLALTGIGINLYKEHILEGKKPSELLSDEQYQLMINTYGSEDEFNKQIIRQSDVQGDSTEFNKITNNGKNGDLLVSLFSTKMELMNYCNEKKINNQQTQDVLNLYESASQKQTANPTFSDNIINNYALFVESEYKDTSAIRKDIRNNPATKAKILAFSRIYGDLEREARKELKMDLTEPMTRQLQDLIAFKIKSNKEAYDETLKVEEDRTIGYTESLDDDYTNIPMQNRVRYKQECNEYYANTYGRNPTPDELMEFSIAKYKEETEGSTKIYGYGEVNEDTSYSPTRSFLR